MVDSLNTKMVTKQLWLIQATRNYNRKNMKEKIGSKRQTCSNYCREVYEWKDMKFLFHYYLPACVEETYLTFFFLVWSLYRIFFLFATTSICKKLEREHSDHQCSEYTAAGMKFSPASLSEYQYLGSSNGSKDDF